MRYHTRWIEKTVTGLAATRPAVYIGGARQAGKTTLLRHLFPTLPYVTFDSPTAQRQAMDDPRHFIGQWDGPVILDEVQYVPELMRYIKMAIDEHRKPGRWLLTGSQQYAMMRGLSETLAGRVGIARLLPFSAREWRGTPAGDWPSYARDGAGRRPQAIRQVWRTIRHGLFPELCTSGKIGETQWFDSYVQTYLERDLRTQLRVGDLREFERFLRAVAVRTGQMVNYADLARDVGIAVSTAREWVSALQSGFQVYLLEPYHRNLGKRLTKSPKLYWHDTGLAAYLLNIRTDEEAMRSPFRGALFENWVVMELLKTLEPQTGRPAVWYWRTSNGTEVDVIVESGSKLWPVEIKSGATFHDSWLAGMRSFRTLYGNEAAEGTVFNTGEHGSFSSDAYLYDMRRW